MRCEIYIAHGPRNGLRLMKITLQVSVDFLLAMPDGYYVWMGYSGSQMR